MVNLTAFLLVIAVNFMLNIIIAGMSLFIHRIVKIHHLLWGISHVSYAVFGLLLSPKPTSAAIVQSVCIIVWTVRLTTFLLWRVLKNGKNNRFFESASPLKRIGAWAYELVSGVINILPSLFLWISSKQELAVSFLTLAGWIIFTLGFLFETISDYQKAYFRRKDENKERFISHGLWSISRHPNYFGEIVLWFGLFLAAVPYFSSQWAYFTLLCPVATTFKLCFLNGIPQLEKRGVQKWGSDRSYAQYVYSTGVLIPWLVCCECTTLPNRALLVDDEEHLDISRSYFIEEESNVGDLQEAPDCKDENDDTSGNDI